MLIELREQLIERYKEYYERWLDLFLSDTHTEGTGILAGHLQEISYILHVAYNMDDNDIRRIELFVRKSKK